MWYQNDTAVQQLSYPEMMTRNQFFPGLEQRRAHVFPDESKCLFELQQGGLQGYLVHKKTPNPQDLGGGVFL